MKKRILSGAVPADVEKEFDKIRELCNDPQISKSQHIALMIAYAAVNQEGYLEFAQSHIMHHTGLLKKATL